MPQSDDGDFPDEYRPPAKRQPWHEPGRLALIEYEPVVEQMIVRGCARSAIVRWLEDQGATEDQAQGLLRGIRAKWRENNRQHLEERRDEYAAQLDAALYDAWHRPVFEVIKDEESGIVTKVPLKTKDGAAVTQADMAAIPKILKLKAELHGLNAPSKSVHLHGELPTVAAMSPVERQAEIDQLLARRAAALGQADAAKLPSGKAVIDVGEESAAKPR